MIVLQESASEQTLKFILREFTSGATYNVTITNELTSSEVYNQDVTSISSNLYFNEFTGTFSLKENNYYILTIKSGLEVIYRDKIYCTNQTVTDYTVNESGYITHSTTDEFITL